MYNILMHTTHLTCQSYVIVVCKLDFEAPEVLKASCIFLSELQCLPGFSQRAAFRTGTLCLLDDLRALLLYEYNLHGSGEPKLINSSISQDLQWDLPRNLGILYFSVGKNKGKRKLTPSWHRQWSSVRTHLCWRREEPGAPTHFHNTDLSLVGFVQTGYPGCTPQNVNNGGNERR